MLPEDGHSESVREYKPVIEGVRDAPGEEGARASAPKLDDIRIDGRIGTDPEELKHWAAHVVAGNPIEHMEIADLRALIEAVQKHPGAKLAPADAMPGVATAIVIREGRVRVCDCGSLDIQAGLFVTTMFQGNTSFQSAFFGQAVSFLGSVFKGPVSFTAATFLADANFESVVFGERCTFDFATFRAESSYVWARFGAGVSFEQATFRGRFSFDLAGVLGWCFFDRSEFCGPSTFEAARFHSGASFDGVSFRSEAVFSEAVFASTTQFGPTIFDGNVYGDLRSTDTSKASATRLDTRRRHSPWIMIDAWREREAQLAARIASHQERPWDDLPSAPGFAYRVLRAIARPIIVLSELSAIHRRNRSLGRVLRQVVRSRVVHGTVGWNLVRALGRLSILNRVSLVALIAVPVLAAAYGAAQKIVAGPNGAAAPVWIKWFARAIGGSPHLSETLALTFFASVLVTIGLLIYQAFAPDTIKQRDEDEHVRELEARYSDENPSLRGDGLRRSIERLEDQAKVRPNRHPSFVKHHGDLIWIPPRDRPEWFSDDDLDEESFQTDVRVALIDSLSLLNRPTDGASLDQETKRLRTVPPKQRPGYVPAAERARICIEEGARAEYWLKAHEKIGWAWVSLVCYLLGIAILLVILFIQCRSVARAAWWPEATQDATRSTG